MTELEIVCVIKENGVLTRVGIGNQTYSVQAVVEWLNSNPTNLCFTYKAGKKAYVEARFHATYQKWYLTTDPDDTKLNNLDFLKPCGT
ncbi:MAG: DUF3892 domain-containing protein [Nitrosotalea sp.]